MCKKDWLGVGTGNGAQENTVYNDHENLTISSCIIYWVIKSPQNKVKFPF